MSIKSDRWIRRMAAERRMIEPFEPGQVKEVKGQRIVSYGTSSYGYDIRCSNEFKLFTNLNSTIVDPKNFDDKSFVDVKGDSCIIPPNSFALARTVEYFRICPPRSTPTRASPRSSSSNPTRSARRPTRTAAGNTRDRRASRCPRSERGQGRPIRPVKLPTAYCVSGPLGLAYVVVS